MHAFGTGLLFGIGLWLSGMAMPRKVLDFLDVTGAWDPSLLLVMGGAVAVTLIGFRPFRKNIAVEKTKIDAPLVLGAAIFGIGWGIVGYCPGPALTALANLSAEAFVFVAAMVGGGLFARILPAKGPGA
jgi:uncharacterized membrane protein YedE/YeeE